MTGMPKGLGGSGTGFAARFGVNRQRSVSPRGLFVKKPVGLPFFMLRTLRASSWRKAGFRVAFLKNPGSVVWFGDCFGFRSSRFASFHGSS